MINWIEEKQMIKTRQEVINQIKEVLINSLIKALYTFSSQAEYLQRFDKVSNILALPDDQKNQLFDNGLDNTGGSRIDNLGLQSRYVTATGYTSDVKDNMIEVLATVVVKTSGSNQQSVNQVIVLHAYYDLKQQKLVSIKINPVQG